MDKHDIFGVVLSSNSLISYSFTLAKRSAILLVVFFTTNRIWSDSLLVDEPIKLHNSLYTVFVYIIKQYIKNNYPIYNRNKLTFVVNMYLLSIIFTGN